MFNRKGISALRPNASTSKSYEAMAVVSENKALRGVKIVLGCWGMEETKVWGTAKEMFGITWYLLLSA